MNLHQHERVGFMSRRFAITATTIGVALLSYLLGGALARDPAGADKANGENLDAQFAQTQIALADVNLKRALASNKKVPNTVSDETLSNYRQELEAAKARLQLLQQGGSDMQFKDCLRTAQSAASNAEAQWHAADNANKRLAGTIDPLDVERFRLQFELARLELQRGEALANGTAEAKLEWEVGRLHYELEQLREKVRQGLGYIIK